LIVLRYAACVVAAGFAACAQVAPTETVERYTAQLSGAQEVPAVASSGVGNAEILYDVRSGMARWTVRYAGLTGPVTAAHIHGPAGPDQNAPPHIPLAVAAQGGDIRGQLRLDAQQANELSSGQWYVNLHTERHPGGELRGQLRIQR
jgi:hypothetical protein